jgi:hypothetical protein
LEETDWKIAPLESLATGNATDRADYAKINAHLDLVFPR